ncbi:ShlB/FhaC/HecB family hemolysin secretion/activation protein [Geobacter sp. AOG1]|uniref:ShlB/FhaC/HecB family hemolysin secretion/activation protein n=1 Tax=Geobacter sp. AOG1 TaxID=1566346 RepID=UPI001CC64E51|nr:ShlB/FhaC/HecB family hemolysin secretion/activation protein [Geobacter sp. AOG1]GFE59356.1 hypothetical protein AOG1_32360 [Geobacter sp. AOG1]
MRGILQKSFYMAMLITLSAASLALAAPPDAGQLLREQQPQRQLPPQFPRVEGEQEKAPLADTGVRVAVKGFRFTGYEGLASESELQALVVGSVGKSLSFGDLQALAAKVTAYLKDKGWFLARAYLPKQDVTSGIIEIAVIQGKSDGSLVIKRDSSARIGEERVRSIAEHAIRPGQPFNEKCLERSVLLINDLPGVSARASMAAGTTPGTTGVQIDVSEGPLLSGVVWGDNLGNRYTGSWRGSGMLNVNDPFRYGDQISLLLTGAEGFTQGRAAYTVPLGSSGLKGNVSYTGMRYELIDNLASLNAEGHSHTVDAGMSYPLLRSRTANVTTSFGYEFKSLIDSAANVDLRDKKLHSGTIGFNGDKYDTLLGGGYTTWNAGVTTGSMDEEIADITITKTEGAYTRFNLGLARLQRLAERLSINLSWSAQFALDNLDTSEKFNLGGPYGIRAYPVGEGSGDEGHLFNVDLRYDLPLPARWGALQLNGFYDAGYITLHKDVWANSIATATDKNNYWLQGGGVGLAYVYNSIFSLKTSWAHTIGNNPGRSADGKDADGRHDDNRFWLQGMIYF